MTKLLSILIAHLWSVDALLLHLSLLLTDVIVRTVCLEFIVVTQAASNLLTSSWALSANILLWPYCIRTIITDILGTVTLPVKHVHFSALAKAYLGQVLSWLWAIASRHSVWLDIALVATLRVIGTVWTLLVVKRELVHLFLLRIVCGRGTRTEVSWRLHAWLRFVGNATWSAQFSSIKIYLLR